MKRFRLLALIFCAVAWTATARASLTMLLSQSIQNSARGREIVFSGTLTNTSGTDKIFLNEIVASLGGSSATNLTLNSNSFFSNVPGILLAGESYSNSELFRILLKPVAPADDYGGTITIRGGADIFANGDLASGNFTVLSPAVSIVTTDGSASEFGPDGGLFTISRTGSNSIDLQVFFTISGTAMNGLAYNSIAPAVTIPAGSNSATVTVTPIPNSSAEGDRNVVLSLGTFATYNLGAPVTDSIIIHDKPVDAWRFEKFGANANDPAAADNADWDGDGLRNLVEFALALDPKVSDTNAAPAPSIAGDHLTISFVPNAAATDLSYIVEASTDFTSWSTSNVEEVSDPNPNPPGLRTFRYALPVSMTDRAFLRLRLVRTDL